MHFPSGGKSHKQQTIYQNKGPIKYGCSAGKFLQKVFGHKKDLVKVNKMV